jgi:hypothetical protein
MITLMPTTARPQQRDDHRLQHLVHRSAKRAQQLGVAFQEGPKINRSGPRHHIDEGVLALPVDRNGQFVREGAHGLGVLRAKDQRQILARDPMREREMRQLVLLGRELRAAPIGQHGIEEHR